MAEKIPALILSNKDIESLAEEFLDKHFPEVLKRPTKLDQEKLLSVMKEYYSFEFQIIDLGYNNDSIVLGRTDFKNKIILVNSIFFDDEFNRRVRLPFVIAHEVGHCVIHAKHYLALKESGVFAETVSDTKDEITGKRIFTTERDFLEHQANVFASAILVPHFRFAEALRDAQKGLGISRNIGTVYLDHNQYNTYDYLRTADRIALRYGVSREIIKIRLRTLNLINQPDLDRMELQSILADFFTNH